MKAFVIKILISFAVFFGLISILEFGFYLRSSNAPAPIASRDSDSQSGPRVLLIGDSVMGFLAEPKTLANEIQSAWTRIQPGAMFSEIARPGLLTSEALEALPSKLNSFRPDVAIVMIGRSDFGRDGESELALLAWISKLHVGRFARLLMRDASARFYEFRSRTASDVKPADPVDRHDQLFNPPWKLYGELKYKEAIPLFEQALKEKPQYENGIRALYHSYVQASEFARGIDFFKNLRETSRHRSLLEVYVASLRIRNGEDRQKVALSLESIEGARLAFKTRMWFLKSQNDDQEFRRLLETVTVAENAPRVPKAARGIVKIAEELKTAGVRTVFLSYPTDHVDQLKKELSSVPDVRVYDLRTWILESPPPTSLYIEEDIEHMTQLATPIVANQLVEAERTR